jgi:hypothetical protein
MNKGRDQRYWSSIEVLGELVLLFFVGAFFIYMFVGSFSWPPGSAFLPRIAIVVGTPFWIIRVVSLLRHAQSSIGEIMDMGFVGIEGDDPKSVTRRLIRACVFVLLLYLAIWLFGFHVALPMGVFIYLLRYGGIGWVRSGLVALTFLAFIVGLYDVALDAYWPEPAVLALFR